MDVKQEEFCCDSVDKLRNMQKTPKPQLSCKEPRPEVIILHLTPATGSDLPEFDNCYVRIASGAKICHVRKLVAMRALGGIKHHPLVDVLFNFVLLKDEYTLKELNAAKYSAEDTPLRLQYRRQTGA